jgi:proton glutamate symport protein
MTRTWIILSALVAGLAFGAGWTSLCLTGLDDAVGITDSVGGIWLDGLRMTIIPLVVSLLITGIAKTVDSARGDRMALQVPDHDGGGECEPGPCQRMQGICHRLPLRAADQH